jgi:PhnB protein
LQGAVAAGSTQPIPPTGQSCGVRGCRLRDPSGHAWLIGHWIEQPGAEEMQPAAAHSSKPEHAPG